MEERETIRNIVEKTLSLLGFSGDIKIDKEEESNKVRVAIKLPGEAGMLIGKGGETLRSLQHILLLAISKKTQSNFAPGSFIVDVNDYQKDRENYLVALAKNAAQQVVEINQPRELQPMPAAERRIIHLTLASVDGVKTESVGDRRERKIIVRPA